MISKWLSHRIVSLFQKASFKFSDLHCIKDVLSQHQKHQLIEMLVLTKF